MQHQATFSIGPGLTSLVGPNNAGKSTVLRFLSGIQGRLPPPSRRRLNRPEVPPRGPRQNASPQNYTVAQDYFTDLNERDLSVEMKVVGAEPASGSVLPGSITATFDRENVFFFRVDVNAGRA